jgi:SAM-dependent MidA family methyltransferase
MEACNSYYYATRDPLGAGGDFTTAPEISQMFGELVGAALADCWHRSGRPADAVYAELGPGRGTLAADALRVLRKSGFSGAVHLVETSPALRTQQDRRVPDAQFHATIEELPPAPLLLSANEFLDALPVRQWAGDRERGIGVEDGVLTFTGTGPIREDSPARERAVGALAAHLARHGGVALVADYGHAQSAAGDTLQAVRSHRFADVLSDPGEADLTAHVDFEAVARAARRPGVQVTATVAQGVWLDRLGIAARAAALSAAHPERADEIAAARERLCGSEAMGELFKLIALHGANWARPAGFDR